MMMTPKTGSLEVVKAEINLKYWLGIAPDLVPIRDKVYGRGGNICPPKDLVFRALEMVHPDNVRVVILGQDPYYTIGKANGLAFGYHQDWGYPPDASMSNIMRELGGSTDLSLEPWAHQGVLLLNTRLTVEENRPLSHSNLGWEKPVGDIIRFLAKKPRVVWLLWGREADSTANRAGLDIFRDNVIYCRHPSPLSAGKQPDPFLGSGCFQKANELLKSHGKEEIQWTRK